MIFFAAWTIVCGLLVNWGYTIPDYWDEPEWVPMMCKIVGFIGQYEDSLEMDEYYLEHGTAIIEPYKGEED